MPLRGHKRQGNSLKLKVFGAAAVKVIQERGRGRMEGECVA